EHVPAVAVVEELHPGRGRPASEWLEIVDPVEEGVAGGAAGDDLEEAVPPGGTVDAFGPGAVFAHDTPLKVDGRPMVTRAGRAAQLSRSRGMAPRPVAGPGASIAPRPVRGVDSGRTYPNRSLAAPV